MQQTTCTGTGDRSLFDRFTVPTVALEALLLFFVALSSSPSILHGLVPDVLSKSTSVLLIAVMAARCNYRQSGAMLVPWSICFTMLFISGVAVNLSSTNAAPAFYAALLLFLSMALTSRLRNKAFVSKVAHWWIILFWIISVCTLANMLLIHTVPSIFRDIDYGQISAGNVRNYLVSPFGAVIVQDYGAFVVYRVTGILAEPGMMSMFFLANATLGILYKDSVFSRRFGIANLLAAFATQSLAFYCALLVTTLYYVIQSKRKKLQIFVAILVLAGVIALSGQILDGVQSLFDRSSMSVRQSDADYLVQRITDAPWAILTGYAWWGDYRQFPSAYQQIFYQAGLIGVISYVVYLWRILRGAPLAAVVILVCGASIDYQTFWIFPLLLFVVGAYSVLRETTESDNSVVFTPMDPMMGQGSTAECE
jgi:hypothetical protein